MAFRNKLYSHKIDSWFRIFGMRKIANQYYMACRTPQARALIRASEAKTREKEQ